MNKSLKSLGIIILLILCGYGLDILNTKSSVNKNDVEVINKTPSRDSAGRYKDLNSEYKLVTSSVFYESDVTISSSTPSDIYYQISTVNKGHIGNLRGFAIRDKSTTTLAYVSNDYHKDEDQSGCQVTIYFNKENNLTYIAQDKIDKSNKKNQYSDSCSSYHGAHGSFFDGDLHVKNVTNTLPTLLDLGFTKSDRDMYISMSKDVAHAEIYVKEDIYYMDGSESTSSARSVVSTDIKNSFGYLIESANMYNATFACDFVSGGGYCEYGAFLKDNKGGYWMMGGSNSSRFIYKTNRKEWYNKLPKAFIEELSRLDLSIESVDFKNL